ncbi:MAG TPA: thiamine ABC transporter substrate-binding protein [Dongiaceae bacterium]|jgi:thiamine transport system substrate-binding protein|nr:thiamine ABC transporter substrate-binding protein [Dongiaceae bacterium]
MTFKYVTWLAVFCVFLFGSHLKAQELRLITHDAFDLSPAILDRFEKETGAKVTILKSGDAGAMLNKLILTREAPIADLVYGLDNLLIAKAEAAHVLAPYASPAAARLPSWLHTLPDFTPTDISEVAINYDKAAISKSGLALPSRIEDFTQPAYRGLLVVENPATSSTGLAFLAATIEHFGEPMVWKFWAALRDNGLAVADGWTEAYEKMFSRNGGTHPFVVSYTTSPPAEVFYSDPKPTEPPTASLPLPGGTFTQIEGIALVAGGSQEALAKKFIDYMLSPGPQADLPGRMWVYPAFADTPLPDLFRFATRPAQGSLMTEADAGKIEGWVKEWTRIVVRAGQPQ